jgi:hypothetical protein
VNTLDERLNRILPVLTSEYFRNNKGLGNEVPFYAFDYSPEEEPRVREHIAFVVEQLRKGNLAIQVAHINLFAVLIDMLEARGFYDKAVALQSNKGDAAAAKALQGPLKPDKVAKYLTDRWPVAAHDVYLIEGVGSAYPLIRTHNLLNNLQPLLGLTPLVLFFPGQYDGQSLRLFGYLNDKPYYRAFRLVS